MNSLKVAQKHDENEHSVQLIGSIDENTELPDLSNELDSPKIIFDLKKITYLNSIGIAKWVKWITHLSSHLKSKKLVFRNCPQIFVNQMNTIKNFCPSNVVVETFEVPFYCEDCNYSSIATYELGKEYINSSEIGGLNFYHPEFECPKCGTDMELDVIESKYFSFLKEEN